jgi:hypothetical protein
LPTRPLLIPLTLSGRLAGYRATEIAETTHGKRALYFGLSYNKAESQYLFHFMYIFLLSHNVVSSKPRLLGIRIHHVSVDRH